MVITGGTTVNAPKRCIWLHTVNPKITMQYSIYTRGFNTDYCWKHLEPRVRIQDYLNANGVLVARDPEGKFDVYLCSPPTEKKDYMGRKISIAVFVSGCTEAKAKGLAGWALEHWNNSADTFSTFVDDFGKDEWTANNSVLKQWVDNVAEVAATDIPFGNRLGNGNTDESRKELITELRQFKFNQKAGFKLVVDGGLMTGQRFKDIQYDVDRYLYKDGDRKALPDKIASEKSPAGESPVSKSPKRSSSLLGGIVGLFIGVAGCLGWFYPMLNEFSTLKELRTAVVNAEKDRDNAVKDRDNAVKARNAAKQEESDAILAKTTAEQERLSAVADRDRARSDAQHFFKQYLADELFNEIANKIDSQVILRGLQGAIDDRLKQLSQSPKEEPVANESSQSPL